MVPEFFNNFELKEDDSQELGQIFACKLLIRPLVVILRKAKKMHSLRMFNDVNTEGEHELTFVISCEYGAFFAVLSRSTTNYIIFTIIVMMLLSLQLTIATVVSLYVSIIGCIVSVAPSSAIITSPSLSRSLYVTVSSTLLLKPSGIRRRHRFIYQACDIVSAMFDDEVCNRLRVMPKVLCMRCGVMWCGATTLPR